MATTILLVFSELSNIAFAEDHSVTSWIIGCSLAFIAAMLFPEAERDESSANMSQSTSVDEMLNGRSCIYVYMNTEEKRSKNRPLWKSNFDKALR